MPNAENTGCLELNVIEEGNREGPKKNSKILLQH